MTAALEIKFDDGNVQLSSESYYMSLYASGSVTIVGGTDYTLTGYSTTVTIAVPSFYAHMFAVRSDEGACWYECIEATSTQMKYRVRVATLGIKVYWYLFSSIRPKPNASNMGLELYSKYGECIFASDTPIARVLGTITATSASDVTYTGVSLVGKTYAVVCQKSLFAYRRTVDADVSNPNTMSRITEYRTWGLIDTRGSIPEYGYNQVTRYWFGSYMYGTSYKAETTIKALAIDVTNV